MFFTKWVKQILVEALNFCVKYKYLHTVVFYKNYNFNTKIDSPLVNFQTHLT